MLKAAGFDSVLVVDDAFDEVPVAADLSMDADAWSIFIDDLGADSEHVESVFPKYREMNARDLSSSDEFVKAVYGLKGTIRPELWNTLFESYERDQTSDRGFLKQLCMRLTEAGLTVVAAGRMIPESGRACRLIFADLFLGASQQDFDVEESIKRLESLVDGRRAAPPAVVLMSRSPRLRDKKERFRDDAKLVGALFRVYRKQDLLEGSTVETLIERLATHYADAARVAAFLTAWETGLSGAVREFMKLMRRLDLPDYSKIREVLLDVEGQPLGSYMLDVFDRVLQHEIEGQAPTIAAAQELNLIDQADYPAPNIAGSPDLQNLVARVLWQHSERLRVSGNTAGMPVSFGDVLVSKDKLETSSGRPTATAAAAESGNVVAEAAVAPPQVAPAPAMPAPGAAAAPAVDHPDVLIVLTPACDLVRNPEKRRVLMVGGSLKPLDSKTWRYKRKGATTPILQLPDQPRMFIEWDLDDQRMLNRGELEALLSAKGPYAARARLRESNALELQQRLLSDLGRVGLVSTMPFTFPVEVHLFTADLEGNARKLDLPVTTADGGVCICGRDSDGNDHTRLVLTEAAVDEILGAVLKLDESDIHTRAKETLARLQKSASFRSVLQHGIKVPAATSKGNLQPLKVPSDAATAGPNAVDEVVGLIVRNPGEFSLSKNDCKSGAIIIVLNDVDSVVR